MNIDKLIHAINHHPEIQGQYKVDNKDTFVFELIDYLTDDSIHEINSPIEHLLDEASVAIVECGTDSFIEIGDDND